MELQYKPDFERARTYWRAFWEGEIIDRPCVAVTAPLPGRPRQSFPYMTGFRDGHTPEEAAAIFERAAAGTYFGGEAIPFMELSFGPDQMAGFLGAEIHMAEDRATSWAVPCVEDLAQAPLDLKDDNPTWHAMLDFYRRAAVYADGKFLLGMLDLHSNLDLVGALRGMQRLCVDMVDRPDEVLDAITRARRLYAPIYDQLYAAGDMARRGSIGWTPFYCEGKFATIQCDYICLISPRQARKFAIPALEEESAFLDHCVYHYDGPAALVHLDSILAIPGIDVIQWVSGDGQPPMHTWVDVLKRVQAAGKGLQMYGVSVEDVKRLSRELRPEKVLYCVGAESVAEADGLLEWLKQNT
jgi:hypothetical protein